MTVGNTQSIDALRPEIWQKELYADVIANLYFTENGMMGEDDNNIIQIKPDLQKQKGDAITFGLTARLTGNGVSGDDELEGNEEKINAYSESISINQKRFAVRLEGKLDEQKNAYNMRTDAKSKLSDRVQEFVERQAFLKMAGVGNTSLTDVGGAVVGADCTWSNTPDVIPAADENTGYGNRYLCADYTSGTTSLAATDLITPALISRLKVKAQMANPKVRPLKIKGKNYYVLFVHPWQAFDLKRNPEFAQAMRDAEARGKDNPIFTGALGIWDGVILHEHEYVPFLDVSALTNDNFAGAGGGTACAVDAFRAILVGRQALGFAKCQNENGWVEETFDYKNKTGFATGLIGGIQKIMFNSKEYGTVVLDTSATALL
ncbi:MAG: N4-gp56 family major capsid protein [Elusimicrobia bacterium]|nr:N4-gp56 family major capsid protein [Elusimicrobiota bacterium]